MGGRAAADLAVRPAVLVLPAAVRRGQRGLGGAGRRGAGAPARPAAGRSGRAPRPARPRHRDLRAHGGDGRVARGLGSRPAGRGGRRPVPRRPLPSHTSPPPTPPRTRREAVGGRWLRFGGRTPSPLIRADPTGG